MTAVTGQEFGTMKSMKSNDWPKSFEIWKPWNAISGSHLKFFPNPGNDFLTEIIQLHT